MIQLGNQGGQPYWSWYGFNSRVEWCACFVSWCADQCGYIESGLVPKFAGCVAGLSQIENGKTALMNQRQEILSSLIGKATVQQTTLVS